MKETGIKRLIILTAVSLAGLASLGVQPALALPCGTTISVDTTLTSNVGPCIGDGLIIDTAGVTLDLNKKKIRGSGACSANPACFTPAFPQSGSGVVVDGVANVTIKNGTIEDSFRNGIDVRAGSDNTLIENLTIKDDLVFAVFVRGSDDVVVRDTKMRNPRDTKMRNLAGNGLDVVSADNFTLENNEIKKASKARQLIAGVECGIGNGIFIFGSAGAQILNNKFDDISQSAILYWDSDDGLIDNNHVNKTSFLPCGPPANGGTDFGAITIVAGSTRTIVSRNTVRKTTVQAGIGLRSAVEDIQIHHNFLEKNNVGIFLSNGLSNAAPAIHNNCIAKSTT